MGKLALWYGIDIRRNYVIIHEDNEGYSENMYK